VAEIFEEGTRLRIYFLNPRPPKQPTLDGAFLPLSLAFFSRSLVRDSC
jgi:hypothetical protein